MERHYTDQYDGTKYFSQNQFSIQYYWQWIEESAKIDIKLSLFQRWLEKSQIDMDSSVLLLLDILMSDDLTRNYALGLPFLAKLIDLCKMKQRFKNLIPVFNVFREVIPIFDSISHNVSKIKIATLLLPSRPRAKRVIQLKFEQKLVQYQS